MPVRLRPSQSIRRRDDPASCTAVLDWMVPRSRQWRHHRTILQADAMRAELPLTMRTVSPKRHTTVSRQRQGSDLGRRRGVQPAARTISLYSTSTFVLPGRANRPATILARIISSPGGFAPPAPYRSFAGRSQPVTAASPAPPRGSPAQAGRRALWRSRGLA